MTSAVDVLGCPLKVGDIVMCAKLGQGDSQLYERDILEIARDGITVKLRGFSKWRRADSVISTRPHREMYPEYFI